MRKLFIGGLLVVAALAVAAVAWGATKQTYTQQFTSKAKVNLNTGAVTGLKVQKKEDASAGTVFQASATDPDNPNGQQPQAARRVRIIFPDGTVTDYLAVEQCDADDNEFTDKGEDACDKDTLIGTGYAEVTTNTGTVIKAKVTAFNRKKGLILYIVPEIGQPLVLRPSLKRGPVLETKVAANCVLGTFNTATNQCEFNGQPSTAGEAILTKFILATNPESNRVGRRVRVFIRTPEDCPRNGRWVFAGEFLYGDGSKSTLRSNTACNR